MPKPVLISGIQPTGKLHLGNYLGVLENFVHLQNLKKDGSSEQKHDCYFFVADLHSLTENTDQEEKLEQIKKTASIVRAFGVGKVEEGREGEKVNTFFLQSAVPAHSELAIILNNLTPFAELQRMTQFKDKSKDQSKNINVGLFDYPVLMAADILLYNASFVPVGDDQSQHLELARTIARKFNSKFGKTFNEPEPLFSDIPRVMSLDDPKKKMSKSRPEGCLFLDDSPETIMKKIKRAVTDSGNEIEYGPKKKPAISNLMNIYSAVIKNRLIKGVAKDIENEYKGKGYSKFKEDLALGIINLYKRVKTQEEKITDKVLKELETGSKEANRVASKRIKEIKDRMGLPLLNLS